MKLKNGVKINFWTGIVCFICLTIESLFLETAYGDVWISFFSIMGFSNIFWYYFNQGVKK